MLPVCLVSWLIVLRTSHQRLVPKSRILIEFEHLQAYNHISPMPRNWNLGVNECLMYRLHPIFLSFDAFELPLEVGIHYDRDGMVAYHAIVVLSI